MHKLLRRSRVLLLFLSLMSTLHAAEARASGWDGKVIFMRHALAPGTGDPSNFRLDDCSTQRNLNEVGREQARAIGSELQAAGVLPVAIYSSQWCRCWQTAELLGLGAYSTHPGLNSFFQGIVDRKQTLELLEELMSGLDTSAGPYIFVTHQVVISAVTGLYTASGAMVVYDLVSGSVSAYSDGGS